MMNMNPYSGVPMDINPQYLQQQPANNPYGYINQSQNPAFPQQQQKKVDPRQFETPEITMGDDYKPLFGTIDSKPSTITVDNLSDAEKKVKKEPKAPRKKKESVDGNSIIKVDNSPSESVSGDVIDDRTIYSYGETNALLHETLGQIDAINVELVQEFNAVRHNRTMKNKYMVLNNLSENIGSMLSNRIATIKEINNCITKANDMDYKKYKDIQAAQSSMSDDKYIADLYTAFISQPQNLPPQYQLPSADSSLLGSGIVRANVNSNDISGNGGMLDTGYLSYVANMTPEQNAMRYETNPNVKQCVIFDAATGAKYFQMMDVSTGEAIPNMPVYDQMFMEDVTIDVDKKIAKSINLNETFPLIVLNNSTTSQY